MHDNDIKIQNALAGKHTVFFEEQAVTSNHGFLITPGVQCCIILFIHGKDRAAKPIGAGIHFTTSDEDTDILSAIEHVKREADFASQILCTLVGGDAFTPSGIRLKKNIILSLRKAELLKPDKAPRHSDYNWMGDIYCIMLGCCLLLQLCFDPFNLSAKTKYLGTFSLLAILIYGLIETTINRTTAMNTETGEIITSSNRGWTGGIIKHYPKEFYESQAWQKLKSTQEMLSFYKKTSSIGNDYTRHKTLQQHAIVMKKLTDDLGLKKIPLHRVFCLPPVREIAQPLSAFHQAHHDDSQSTAHTISP